MWQSLGKMGFCPYFLKYLAQCFCFETIKHCVFVLKFDFKKIELQVEFNSSNIEFYAYFDTSFFVENLSETRYC